MTKSNGIPEPPESWVIAQIYDTLMRSIGYEIREYSRYPKRRVAKGWSYEPTFIHIKDFTITGTGFQFEIVLNY